MKTGGRTSAKTAESALHNLVNGGNTHMVGMSKCHKSGSPGYGREMRVNRWYSNLSQSVKGWQV